MSNVFDAYALYYDLLYSKKDYKKETEYVRDILAKKGITKGSILELGCGTGKHAEQFAKMGFSVHGIDLSPEMINKANKQKPTHLSKKLYFETGNACNFHLDKKFDVVISLFHVASYMTSNKNLISMFETAGKHLKTGGIFVFDFWFGPGVLTTPPETKIKRMSNKEVDILRIAEPKIHPNENIVDVNYNVQVKKKHLENIIEINEIHKMRYLFIPEIKRYCEPWFLIDSYFAWMKLIKPDLCDWLCISLLVRK